VCVCVCVCVCVLCVCVCVNVGGGLLVRIVAVYAGVCVQFARQSECVCVFVRQSG